MQSAIHRLHLTETKPNGTMEGMQGFPKMVPVRQVLPASAVVEASGRARECMRQVKVSRGARVAVAVGSRGISNLQQIVAGVLSELIGAGAKPFIVPAMGSHG